MKKLLLLIIWIFTIFNFVSAYTLTDADIWIVNAFEKWIFARWENFTIKIVKLFKTAVKQEILNTRKTAIVVELLDRLEKEEITQTNPVPEGLLDLVNLERSKLGLPNLTLNEKLNQSALNQANYLRDVKIFSHIWENNSTLADRVTAQWYTRSFVAENIAGWHTNINQVLETRMNSPGHKANILSDQATEIWLARVGNYRVQVFARPR